jgi:Holliday junction resolvase RusA-like endonuclease
MEASMPEEIKIVVPGTPMGKPRMTRSDKWKKRDCVVRSRAYADLIRSVSGPLPGPEQIADLSWTAYFRPAESWSQKKKESAIGTRHRQKPDRDNIDKQVLDSLFEDDSAVADGTLRKRWDWTPRLEITIQLEPDHDRPVPAGKRRKGQGDHPGR